MDMVVFGGYGDTPVHNRYYHPFGYGGLEDSIGVSVFVRMPCPGRFHDLHVHLPTAPGVGTSRTLQFFDFTLGGADATTPSVTISDSDTDGDDLTGELAIATSGSVALYHTVSGSPAASNMYWSYKFTPDTAKYSVLAGTTGDVFLSEITAENLSFGGQADAIPNDEFIAEIIVPTSGTFRLLNVAIGSTPGSGNSRVFVVRKNGVDTALTTTISNSEFAGDDAVNSFTVVAGDTIALKTTPISSPTATRCQFSLVFEADTDGLYIIPCSSSKVFSNKGTRYVPLWVGDSEEPNSIEADRQLLCYVGPNVVSLENMYIEISGTTGFQNSVTFTHRQNGADTALTKLIAHPQTAGNVVASVPLVDGDLLTTKIVPFSTPTARHFHVSYTAKVNAPTVWIKGGTLLGGKIGP